jgi:hypothetical protein
MDKKVKRDKGRFVPWRWLQHAERPELCSVRQTKTNADYLLPMQYR